MVPVICCFIICFTLFSRWCFIFQAFAKIYSNPPFFWGISSSNMAKNMLHCTYETSGKIMWSRSIKKRLRNPTPKQNVEKRVCPVGGYTSTIGQILMGEGSPLVAPINQGNYFWGINCLEHHGFVDSHGNLGYPLVGYD